MPHGTLAQSVAQSVDTPPSYRGSACSRGGLIGQLASGHRARGRRLEVVVGSLERGLARGGHAVRGRKLVGRRAGRIRHLSLGLLQRLAGPAPG